MTAWRKVKTLGLVTLASSMALTFGAAHADYENAMESYKLAKPGPEGARRVNSAIDLWRKSALAGDVRSAKVLGDLYSFKDLIPGDDEVLPEDTQVVRRDASEALAWYIIAATHNFSDYQQFEPEAEAINARTVARLSIPELRSEMTDDQVKAAELLVVRLLSTAGSNYDLLRLGKMHLEGNGLEKSNIKALMYFYLARSRGRGGNADANTLIEKVTQMLTQSEVNEATELMEAWQPPLPETFAKNEGYRELTAEEEEQFAYRIDYLTKTYRESGENLPKYYQSALRALGYYWGDKIDGNLFSAESKAAIQRFQFALLSERAIEDRVPANPDPELTDEEEALIRDQLVPQLSPLQIVDLMRLAARRNHPESMYFYGNMLTYGTGVPRDGVAAIEMYTKAAEAGEKYAHYAAGIAYAEGIISPIKGRSLTQSYSKACYHLGQARTLKVPGAAKDIKRYCSVPDVK